MYRHSPTYNLQLENFFCLASDPRQEKRQSCMPVDLKRAEFAPAGVQAGSPSRTFHPDVNDVGGKFQSKNYTGRNVNSYINMAPQK